jgi:uncharacterized oligopeptide transporter (OPT) family protein
MPVSQGGYVYPLDAQGGIGDDVMASMAASYGVPTGDDIEPTQGVTDQATFGANTASVPTPKASYMWYIAAVVVVLLIIKFASEHEKSGIDPQFVGIGVYNFVAVTFMAVLGIWVVKIIANKYGSATGPTSGLTDLINAA